MTIDVDRCNGCSACVVACNIENNIPVVGEEGVQRNRQMNWLRIERYVGDGEASSSPAARARRTTRSSAKPTCATCRCCVSSAAPRPASPSARSSRPTTIAEGLNGMIYNRCIGTRYCSNNCPYKVRRFNWFDYQIENWPGADAPHAQPGRHGPRPGRDGEVHLLRPAHRGRSADGQGRGPTHRRRRGPDGLPADLPDPGDHLRQPQGRREPRCRSRPRTRSAATTRSTC